MRPLPGVVFQLAEVHQGKVLIPVGEAARVAFGHRCTADRIYVADVDGDEALELVKSMESPESIHLIISECTSYVFDGFEFFR